MKIKRKKKEEIKGKEKNGRKARWDGGEKEREETIIFLEPTLVKTI